MGLLSEIRDDLSDLGYAFKEFGEDMHEIFTEGVKEILINDNSNYKTSSQTRVEARSIIDNADEKRDQKRNQAKKRFEQAEMLQKKVLESRNNILSNVSDSIRYKQSQLQRNFSDFSSPEYNANTNSSYITSLNMMDFFGESASQMFSGKGVLSSFIEKGDNPFTTRMNSESSMRKRINAANEYLSDAETYKVDIERLCAEIDSVLLKLTETEKTMKEELRVHEMVNNSSRVNLGFNYNEALGMLRALNSIGVTAPEYKNRIDDLKRRVK